MTNKNIEGYNKALETYQKSRKTGFKLAKGSEYWSVDVDVKKSIITEKKFDTCFFLFLILERILMKK